MDGHQTRRKIQRYRSGYFALLILVALSSLLLLGTLSRPAYAAGSGDLLKDVPVVDENTLNNAACGIAAATMVLDYYLPQSGPIHQAIDIVAVSKYVKEYYGYDATNTLVPQGSTYEQLQTGIEAATTAPELNFGVPLKASWHTTDDTHWFSVLQSELDAKRPIILFLANGGTLGWNWKYGHFIVVSGYTSDESIIYHDPWDGKPHTMSNVAFALAWGTIWNGNAAWQYMTIIPPTPNTSTTATTKTPASTIKPGGLWISPPSPNNGDTVTEVIHFAAHAYPTHPGDPAIAKVNFTVSSQGAWQIACTVTTPVTGDEFACDVNLKNLGIPYGQIQVSFDVYDQAGNVNYAPNGVHTLTYAPSPGVTPVPPTPIPPTPIPPTPVPPTPIPPTPIPPTPVPPTLSVSPSSRVNNFQDCSTETHGGSGFLISCPFVLSNSTQTTSTLNWSVSANNPRVIFDQSSGTLAPGQSITINAGMYGNGNGSLACPGINMTLVFNGSVNTIQVPLICTDISTNPGAYSFDNTYCSHNGNWVCVITVTADPQNAMDTPWAATVQTPDPGVTFSPAQGTLAPGGTVQVTITILNSDCPGNNTFFFYVPGGLPLGENYLGWSC